MTCSVTDANWCMSGYNTGSGIGVIGTSKTGTGLRGTSTSQYGLKATSVSGTAILAQSTSGEYGVNATARNGYGVLASGFDGLYSSGTEIGVIADSPDIPLIAQSRGYEVFAVNAQGDVFDYRIVATVSGKAGQRMQVASASAIGPPHRGTCARDKRWRSCGHGRLGYATIGPRIATEVRSAGPPLLEHTAGGPGTS